MTRKTHPQASERTEADNTPDKFPPDGQYTARAIAEFLGVHEDTIRKRYYDRYCSEVFKNCPELLKKGPLYTQIFFDECFRIRQTCDSDRLVLNAKGQIVRHTPEEAGKLGLPATEGNPERMTKAAYIKMRCEEMPELRPEVPEDSTEAYEAELLDESGLAVYDPAAAGRFQGAIDKTEDLQQSMSNWAIAINQAADKTADQASAQFAERFMERFNRNMGELQNNLGKALGG
jgi:predicted transcriptional regulator